ncbi:MAG: DUF169 domain-containing protein [Dehalococcoidia bacterium]|nr:DUF169 domain-containing protein [Dehalococcoidia bacterium]
MKKSERDNFTNLWQKHFGGAELPLAFYYTDEEGRAPLVKPSTAHRCLIAALLKARKGAPLAFNGESIGCFGGRRYAGFATKIMANFEYFLSCGIPGKLKGERYKKSPALVKQVMQHQQPFTAPGRYIIFKRWDLLEQSDTPRVAIFFARPDVLAGLFTLANFDETEPNGVISPFGSGCSSIIYHPYYQSLEKHPRPVIGMFDISARPYVDKCELTFALPVERLKAMIANMEESFLITGSWAKIKKRIA